MQRYHEVGVVQATENAFIRAVHRQLAQRRGQESLTALAESLRQFLAGRIVRVGLWDEKARCFRSAVWLQDDCLLHRVECWQLAEDLVRALQRGERLVLAQGAPGFPPMDGAVFWVAEPLLLAEGWGVLEVFLPVQPSKKEWEEKQRFLQLAARYLLPDLTIWQLQRHQTRQEAMTLFAEDAAGWLFWLDVEGRYRLLTPAIERFIGQQGQDVLETPQKFLTFVHPEDRQRMKRHLTEDLEDRREASFAFRLCHPDGRIFWMHHICQPVYDADGRYQGRLGSNRYLASLEQQRAELAARVRSLEMLHELTHCFRPGMDEAKYAQEVLKLLAGRLRWDYAVIRRYDADSDRFRALAMVHQGKAGTEKDLKWLNRRLRASAQGVTGWAVRQQRPVRVDDLENNAHYLPVWEAMRSGIYAPLMYYGQPIGAISVEAAQPAAFSDADLQLLHTIAGQVANTLENIRLMEEVQQRMNDLAALYEATRRLASTGLDAEQVYETLHRAVARLMPFDALVIVLYDEAHQRARAVYLYEDGQQFEPRDVPWGQGLSGRIWRQRRPLCFRDYSRSPQVRQRRHVFGPEDRVVRSVLAIPLQLGERLIGMLSVQSYQRGLYGSHEQSLLQNLSAQASVALENLRLFAERAQHVRELKAVAAVMRLLTGKSRRKRDVGQAILRQALRAIPAAERGLLLLFTPSGSLRVQTVIGYKDSRLFEQDFAHTAGFLMDALRQKRPVLAHHVAESYPMLFDGALPEINEVQSAIAVPLIAEGKIIGAIALDNISDPQAFLEYDEALLEAFAQAAALVLERVHWLDALQHRLQQSERLVQMATAMRENSTRDEILAQALQQMAWIFHLQLALVFTPSADGRYFQARYGAGLQWTPESKVRLPMEHSIGGRVFRTAQAEFIEDIQPQDRRLPYRSENIRDGDTLAVLPLLEGNHIIGVFSLVRRHAFSAQEKTLLQMTAEMLGNALGRVRLLQETHAYANRLATINELGRLLAEAEDLTALYRHLLPGVKTLLKPTRQLLLWRWQAEEETMRLAARLDASGQVHLVEGDYHCPWLETCGVCLHDEVPLVLRPNTSPGLPDWLAARVGVEGLLPVCVLFGQTGRLFGRGVLQFWLPEDVLLTARDEDALLTVAGIVAAEIANGEYLEQSRLQMQRWAQLAQMAHALAGSRRPEQVYYLVYQAIEHIFSCREMVYATFARQQGQFIPVTCIRDGVEDENRLTSFAYTPEKDDVSPSQAVLRQAILRKVTQDAGQERTDLFVPVVYDGQVRGVLIFSWAGRRFFAEDELQLFEAVAAQMAVTLRNHDLLQAQAYRLEQLQALHVIDQAVTSSLDSKVAFEIILREARRMLQVDIAALLRYDLVLHQFVFSLGQGYEGEGFDELPSLDADSPLLQVLTSLQPVFVPAVAGMSLNADMKQRLQNEQAQAAAWLPLVSKGRFHGVLELMARSPLEMDGEWREFALTMAGQLAVALDNFLFFEQLQESNRELRAAYDATIEGWALALELRDRETVGHTRRVTDLTLALARRLGVPDEDLVHIRRGALLHDIGKMGVPDAILHKPRPLTAEEWEIMQRHPEYAHQFLRRIAYLRPALAIPYSHHEKWDGSGYPLGLKGEEIPLAARIFAVVDVYDALVNDRPYRRAWPREKVLQYIEAQSGQHFDPRVVGVFLEMMREETGGKAMAPQTAHLR